MIRIAHFRERNVYREALAAVLEVHEITKAFPFEELDHKYDNIIGMLFRMLSTPEKWIIDSKKGGGQ